MTVQLLEILLILGLIAWQAFIFLKNRALIQRVRTMYPEATQLSVETTEVHDVREPQGSIVDRILQGEMSFRWSEHPGQELMIGEDGDMVQINRWDAAGRHWQSFMSISRATLLTAIGSGAIQRAAEAGAPAKYDALTVRNPSKEFSEVITDTNDYLRANKGAAADFNALRDISEREAELLDAEIEAQISTPLYLGLLGTFGGAILGLFVLVNPFGAPEADAAASAGFNNADVTHFLGGVLIAMVGSLFGLGFTLWGNQLLKSARATRDRLKNDYYNFLQKALLPKLNSDMQQGLNQLRAVLDAFNQDFFAKIQGDFFAKIAEFTPLIGRITENISIQKNFLEKLQAIGYTELANATIKVFDRVDESAASFEKFLGYQRTLNDSVEKGAQTVHTITALLNRLNSLEKALNQVPGYLQEHDTRIREQAQFFSQHNDILAGISRGVTTALNEDANRMNQVLDKRREEFEKQAQQAHAQWDAHFRQLNKDNVYQKIEEYLNPFQQLPAQQKELNRLQEEQARRSTQALQALQEPLEQNRRIQEQLLLQTERTNAILARLTEPNWFQRTILGKKTPPLPPTK